MTIIGLSCIIAMHYHYIIMHIDIMIIIIIIIVMISARYRPCTPATTGGRAPGGGAGHRDGGVYACVYIYSVSLYV